MALRQFRKNSKLITIIITIFFIVSLAMVGYIGHRDNLRNDKLKYAFTINKEKITKLEIERIKDILRQNFRGRVQLDNESIDLLAFDEILNQNLLLDIADQNNINASDSEAKKRLEAEEKRVGKENFRNYLKMNGYTRDSFIKVIVNSIKLERLQEELQKNAVVTNEDIQKYTKLIDNNKVNSTQLESIIKVKKATDELNRLLAEAKKQMKIKDIAPEYQSLVEKVEINDGGFKITNIDLIKAGLQFLPETKGDKEKAINLAKEYYEKKIEMLKYAEKNGITVDKDYPINYLISNTQTELFLMFRDKVAVDDLRLKTYFDANIEKYITPASLIVDIAKLQVKPSDSDKIVSKTKAEKILKELTPINFKEKARVLSEGPSAKNGGELGWFKKGDLVEEFQNAVFKGEIGKVYPTPVETQFGYHLILIEDRKDSENKAKASHILIIPKASEKTIIKKEKEIKELKEKLERKELVFSELKNQDFLVKTELKMGTTGLIPGIGYDMELVKNILKSKIGNIESVKEGSTFYIFEKIEDTKAKKPTFNEVKERVKADYINAEAAKEMEKFN